MHGNQFLQNSVVEPVRSQRELQTTIHLFFRGFDTTFGLLNYRFSIHSVTPLIFVLMLKLWNDKRILRNASCYKSKFMLHSSYEISSIQKFK